MKMDKEKKIDVSSFIYKPKQTKLKNTSRKMTQKEKELFCGVTPILMFSEEFIKTIED